jgi:uncharacterized protein (DUF302 family)
MPLRIKNKGAVSVMMQPMEHGACRDGSVGPGTSRRATGLVALFFLFTILLGAYPMAQAQTDSGIVQIPSQHNVADTIDRLERLLRERGIMVFARIDFSGDAGRAGLTMRAEQMLIFGNPKAGTPLMQAVPVSGLDLPLKALVWEDANGKTWLAYNAPDYVVRRHGLAPALSANLAAPIPILEAATK